MFFLFDPTMSRLTRISPTTLSVVGLGRRQAGRPESANHSGSNTLRVLARDPSGLILIGIRHQRDLTHRAADARRPPVQHVRVDRGRLAILVSEQLLDGPDVVGQGVQAVVVETTGSARERWLQSWHRLGALPALLPMDRLSTPLGLRID